MKWMLLLVSTFLGLVVSTAAVAADDASTEAFLARAAAHIAEQPASATGICLAATSASGLSHDTALHVTRAAADAVLADFARAPAGHQGLGLPPSDKHRTGECADPGTAIFFHDGHCNSADTRYALETARGISCLARATLSVP